MGRVGPLAAVVFLALTLPAAEGEARTPPSRAPPLSLSFPFNRGCSRPLSRRAAAPKNEKNIEKHERSGRENTREYERIREKRGRNERKRAEAREKREKN